MSQDEMKLKTIQEHLEKLSLEAEPEHAEKLKFISQALAEHIAQQESWDERILELTDSIIAMASMDFSKAPAIHGQGHLDAIAAGLTMLGEELKASVEKRIAAESANEAKKNFMANMSHELRTPLTTIMGNLELLLQDNLSESVRDQALRSQQAANTLYRLVSDVLDFARLEAGQLKVHNEIFDIEMMLRDLKRSYSEMAERKGLELVFENIEPNIPLVRGDEIRIRQILNNLMENAIKYTPDGSIQISTTSRKTANKTMIGFQIQDTGIGIRPEHLSQVFERFNRGEALAEVGQEGSGLGLSIALGLAQQMDGTLIVSSAPERGSLFELTIPMQLAKRSRAVQAAHTSNQALEKHILLVEDNPVIQQTTRQMLALHGCTVHIASNGKTALSFLVENAYDLILMDFRLPGMDGPETANQIRERFPDDDTPIVALTANATADAQLLAKNSGMVGYLSKPFTIEQLREIVNRFASNPSQNNR